MNYEKVITRFAPSPTGELHIGSARTALFAYLAARSTDGTFFLRIEDTDRTRYVEGADQRLIQAMDWLNLVPDNKDEIVFQSKRLPIYRKYALDLVTAGKAYICTCSKDKLDADRAALEKAGKLPRYAGTCRDAGIKIEDVQEDTYVIRLKMPATGNVVVHDIVRGDVVFDLSLFDDQILLKSDGYPTYHLASVVDDHEMGINYVLRAEEWLSSTPKHILIYEAFGWDIPKFGHFSMILAPDRTKLSKRHGSTSVEQFRKEGYLPEALINFVAFLGWNPKNDKEFFTLSELEKEFKMENLNRAPAIFDRNKLDNINAHYIVEGIKENQERIRQILENEFGLSGVGEGELSLIGRGGFKNLKEAADYILDLRKELEYPAELLVFKKSTRENTLAALRIADQKLKVQSDWNAESLQDLLSAIVTENDLTNGDVFWPIRVSLSGAEKSPSPVELMMVLGKEESLKRIGQAIDKLSS